MPIFLLWIGALTVVFVIVSEEVGGRKAGANDLLHVPPNCRNSGFVETVIKMYVTNEGIALSSF